MHSGQTVEGDSARVASFTRAAATLLPAVARVVFIPLLGLLFSGTASASCLLAPAAGAADSATAGATIAEPRSPVGAMFGNPAGLAGFEDRAASVGLGLAYGEGQVTATSPAGYQADNEVVVVFPEFGVVVPKGRWTFGMSSVGTSGSRFDYGDQPEVGVEDGILSESAIIGMPLAAAYRVSDRLWIGAELIPLFSRNRLHYSRPVSEFPGDPIPFRYKLYGFGMQAMAGITWRPTDLWSFGFSFRPPGRIWSDGDTKLGTGKQHVDLELQVPAEFSLGISRRLGERWKVSYALRFIDSSVLGTSYMRFSETPSADVPFLPDARDEWRHSLGVEYAWSDTLDLLAGIAEASSIVGNRGVSPAAYDSEDLRLNTGMAWTRGIWAVDGALGYMFAGERNIPDDGRAFAYPGEYESKPAYFLSVTVTRRF